jgi:hypothetical protein
MRILGIMPIAVLMLSLTGCATIVRGTDQEVHITSDPPGASVVVLPDETILTTPAAVTLHRYRVYTIAVVDPDYEPDRKYLDREMDGASILPYMGNLLIGGLIGMAVDLSSGTLYHLVPEPVHFDLEPLSEWRVDPRPEVDSNVD